jgi:hypothetical protein
MPTSIHTWSVQDSTPLTSLSAHVTPPPSALSLQILSTPIHQRWPQKSTDFWVAVSKVPRFLGNHLLPQLPINILSSNPLVPAILLTYNGFAKGQYPQVHSVR